MGTPTGDAVTATVGAAGGSLSSADGRITVTLPPSALSADTSIAIQPISNMAPGGIGDAFRLIPEGTQFAVPATLRFTLSDSDFNGTTLAVMNIASQDAAGHWAVGPATRDSNARTISVTTTHFSDWSLLTGLQLRPPSATAMVNQTVDLNITACYLVDEGDDLFSLVADCEDDLSSPLPPSSPLNWEVNGVANGSNADGTLQANGTSATYTAPAQEPTNNPVAVSVQYGGQNGAKQLLVSNIDVQAQPPASYSGSTTVTYTHQDSDSNSNYKIQTTVTWTRSNDPSHTLPNAAFYTPSGTIVVTGTDSYVDITCTISQTFAIESSDGGLQLNWGGGALTYSAQGFSPRQGTETCPDGPGDIGLAIEWLPNAGDFVPANGVIKGPISFGEETGSFEFSPQQ